MTVGVCCIPGFVLSFRTTCGVLLAPTVFRVVSALSRIPTFNRILVLVLVLTPDCCPCCPCFPLPLPLPCLPLPCLPLPLPNALMSVGSSPPGVTNLSVSRFVLRGLHTHSMFDLFSQDTIRNQSRMVQLHMLLEIIWQQSFKGTHAIDKTVHVSLGISCPSFRWHPSTQAASLAMATKSPSRDFVLVPLCTGPVQLAPALEAMVTSN